MNMLVKVANKMTDLKNDLKIELINIKTGLKEFIINTLDYAQENPGISILLVSLILGLSGNTWYYYFWGSILYIFVLINRRMSYQREKDKIDMIDLDVLSGETNLNTILVDFVSQCFDRDVIFFRGLKEKEYINTKDEKEMLDTLLESVASNISPSLRSKLDMYYGPGRTDIILGRICYQVVTMFVANNNKAIYPTKSNIPNMN